ncbi:MAG TPA: polysaccharide pyruvyl transferase family protein [Cytophagaceae bacterium]|jgi:succinoglycan biosynthesis protein ExoV|nr:polysaccharide pyruvyl transferase family protein [Cytophagaceae bacterium]
MKLLYYKDPKGNFGDDLNPWLWPQFFGEFKNTDPDVFLGIGSILYNDFPLLKNTELNKKIVFGTGIRPSYRPLIYDKSWDIKFLRGPLSAYAFNNEFEYIADGAYAINLIKGLERFRNAEKKYAVSVMPYFKSMHYFNWERICNDLGYHFISPHSEKGVEDTLMEIASSKTIITEAMHGAILADALRVPWSRFVFSTPHTEGGMVSEFKWMDWLYSIQINRLNTTSVNLYRKNFPHIQILNLSNKLLNVEFFIKSRVKTELLKKLSTINNYYLSKDSMIDTISDRINNKIEQLKQK